MGYHQGEMIRIIKIYAKLEQPGTNDSSVYLHFYESITDILFYKILSQEGSPELVRSEKTSRITKKVVRDVVYVTLNLLSKVYFKLSRQPMHFIQL